MNSRVSEISILIRDKARELGFSLVGITSPAILVENGKVLSEWCTAGMNADMAYLAMDIEKRINPSLLFEGARSLVITGLNYFTERTQGGDGIPVLSRYAYGKNYHEVIMGKLIELLSYIKDIYPDAWGKAFVDSSPLLEKAWAVKAGFGWQGKHSLVINKKIGSFFFIGVLITNLELENDQPFMADHCGSCTACIEACPVSAINNNRTIDARKCIAYNTIESKKPVDPEIMSKYKGRVFGCDICQEACPWNRKASAHNTPEFAIDPEIRNMSVDDWLNLEKADFKRLFRNSSLSRKKYEVFMQNVTNVTKSGKSDFKDQEF
jgi:epoxyqueuosine reductase